MTRSDSKTLRFKPALICPGKHLLTQDGLPSKRVAHGNFFVQIHMERVKWATDKLTISENKDTL
jgi:hypothetical protein